MITMRDIEERQEKESLPENPLKTWRAKYDNNSLTTEDFINYFHAACPFFINIKAEGEAETVCFDEQSAKGAILDALENFICGDNPQNVLDKLKSDNNVAAVCGRVFKIGEPTYCCRECGVDPTCVLCVNCFKQSAHRHHKYKMGTSNGGGCCDCGDTEAWKRDPYCEQHVQGLTNSQPDNPIITERMKKACEMVFHAVLSYCSTSLEIDCNGNMAGVDEDEDFYCTVLYNDETHTYEQVIQTLTRTVACPHKNAVDYVTSVDRDGRAVVFCGSFSECMRLKADVEKQSLRNIMHAKSQPLRVTVLHKKALSYQQFALQLLGWLQQFLVHCAAFRKIFCDIITMNTDYNINHLLSNDCKLWKMARTSWHRVLISGMLMEYENKKKFAVVFTKLYASIMQDYIRDDHDHSFSIVSMSVQLFTVPTIGHHLVAHESAFFILMQTFYTESVEKYVQNKVLQFAKTTININVFKRAAYILYDVRYLLNIVPDVWTDDLRKGFLHGMQILIKLLRVMQGMDAVHRQTGSHIEHEPEWESAFNLHIKLAHVISLALDWCKTDKVVLVKVYRMVLTSLSESDFIVSQTVTKVQELADHSVACLMYDVASQPVSIHLPLSRFFAGLYLHLEKFGLSYYSVSAPSAVASCLSLVHLIEPVLCTQTMIAQVHAGMWRRNGYSLLNQLYFYRNVKCRSEMLDRDIVSLQIGASLIESNEFLIHLINKFNLMNWVSPTPWTSSEVDSRFTEEENVRQRINMVDEFLELLIIIIGERYMPGIGQVTEEDRIKKEIIQQLCIKPFSHSELNRTLPDFQHETGMESVINAVAIFNKPAQADRKGVYELKEEFYDTYNMFFYHYSKEEKSKSEEAQRKRKNAKRNCCLPPKLPKLTDAFCMIANLLQCDVMLLIMQTVLEKSLDLKERTFSEGHLQKVLFLIGYGLQDEESGNYPFLIFHEKALKWNILHLLTELASCPRVEALAEHIQWTVKKFKEIQARGDEDGGAGSSREGVEMEEDTAMTSDEQEAAEKQERARLAAEHRAKVMAQMANAQKSFMTENAALFESTKVDVEREEMADAMEWEVLEVSQSIACLGPGKRGHLEVDEIVSCILCSEDVNVSKGGPCMVYSAYMQKSTLIYGPGKIYPHVSSCGHVMHADCWLMYFTNEVEKETRRPYRNRSPASFDTDKKEFLCPLCRCLSNTVIPLASSLPLYYSGHHHQHHHQGTGGNDVLDFGTWCEIMRKYIDGIGSEEEEMPGIYAILEDFGSKTKDLFGDACVPLQQQIDRNLVGHVSDFVSVMKELIGGRKVNKHIEMWQACVYTIQAVEMLLRAQKKPLKGHLSIRQLSCLRGLIRMCGVMGFAMTEKEKRDLLPQFTKFHVLAQSSCILETNVFESLVVSIFATPCVMYVQKKNQEDLQKSDCVIPTGQLMEYYILRVAFLLNIAKILITFNPPVEMDEDPEEGEDELYREVAQKAEERYKRQQEDELAEKEKKSKVMSSSQGEKSINRVREVPEGVAKGPETSEMPEVTEDVPMEAPKEDKKDDDSGLATLLAFFRLHNIYLSPKARKTITSSQLIGEVKDKMVTFLRSSTILFHFITGIEMPEEFSDVTGDTFNLMCEYLGLDSNVESYFVCKKSLELMTLASLHPTIEAMRKGETDKVASPTYLPVRDLVALPEDYSDLINSVSLFTCPNNSRDDTRNPTMCLVCGEVLCSQTYCCQNEINRMTVGACTYHAYSCGAGIVPLLRIRECEVMLLSVSKGCFVSPPYLDEYGEYDAGLRRGNPLHLCRERYEKLRLMWLSHGFYEEIARTMEVTNAMPPTQWELL